jgi:type II secretory pathway component GspD/PulD (secretin)
MKRSVLFVVFILALSIMPSYARDLFGQPGDDASQSQAPQSAQAQPQSADVNYLIRIFHLNYADVKQMKGTINDVLAAGEGVSANEDSNSVVVRASDKNLDKVSKIITEIDKPPLQVNVEAKILELKSGNGDNTTPSSVGFSWQYHQTDGSQSVAQFFSTANPSAGATAIGLFAQVIGGNASEYLQALEKQIGYNLIASPWISAVNHQQAEILIGQRIGYKTLFTSTTGTLQGIDYLNVGTQLKFIPHISSDGYIRMSINPSVSDGVVDNFGVPQTNATETRNQVLVKDGQTVVIGGLTKSYKNETSVGVPILSSIPWIGALFRNKQITEEKREIMVLITPHIVTPEFLTIMQDRADKLDKARQNEQDKGGALKLLY